MDKHEKLSEYYYDKLASRFDKSWDGFLSSFFRKFITKNLEIPEAASVLDVGCANGSLLEDLRQKQFFYGTGLDISQEMVEQARQARPEFNFFQGSAQEMPFPPDSFDVIICSASFHHFPKPDDFLTAVKNLLRPDGKLVLADIRIPLYDLRQIYNWHLANHSQEGDVKVYGEYELKKLLADNDFTITKHLTQRQVQYYEASPKHEF